MNWDDGEAIRLLFHIADAPPHLDYGRPYTYSDEIFRAVARGIKIYPIAASGLNKTGEYIYRQWAQLTMARFLFITYRAGTPAGGPSGKTPHEVAQPEKRIVRRLSADTDLPFRRIERQAGAEAQADFGSGAPIIGADGKHRRSHVLRVCLSFSRKGYSEAFFKQETQSWLAGWENAFWAWGGVPKILQIDNTKAAVNKADWYDPELHPIIISFCRHYGTALMPIKVRTPRHNGKAEANVGYVKGNALKGRTFPTLAAENAHLTQWESRIADLRIHGTTRKQVRQLFEIERSALLPLPAERFPFFHEDQRIVHRDGHIEVEHAYYSVPPEYMGRAVWARWDSRLVRILNSRLEQIALHPRNEMGKFSTLTQHLASRKIALVELGAVSADLVVQ
jgi:hypothetical protein